MGAIRKYIRCLLQLKPVSNESRKTLMHYMVQAISLGRLHTLGGIELGESDPNWLIARSLEEREFLLDRKVIINLSKRRKTIVVSTLDDEPILLLRREDVQIC